jgi:hypothetical protein
LCGGAQPQVFREMRAGLRGGSGSPAQH